MYMQWYGALQGTTVSTCTCTVIRLAIMVLPTLIGGESAPCNYQSAIFVTITQAT